LNHCDRQVVFVLFPLLQKHLSYTDAQLGLTGALFSWIYGLCSPVAGIVGDRVSRARVVSSSLLIWSGITAVSGLASTGNVLLACRGLLAVAESMFMPSAYSLMAAAHPPERRSRAIAIFGTSQLVGVALSGAVSGYLAQAFSWRAPFLLFGAIGLVYVVPLRRFLRRIPERPGTELRSVGSGVVDFIALLRIPTFLVIACFSAVNTFSLFLVYSWLPTFLYDKFSLSLARAGVEGTLTVQIGSSLGLLAGATLADVWYGRRRSGRLLAVVVGLAASAPFLFLIGAASSLAWTRVGCFGFGFFAAFVPANQAACCFDVVPDRLRASTIGMLNLLGSGVAGAGPFLGGLSRSTIGIDHLIAFAALLLLFSAAITLAGIWSFPVVGSHNGRPAANSSGR
jgi:MFS family permease